MLTIIILKQYFDFVLPRITATKTKRRRRTENSRTINDVQNGRRGETGIWEEKKRDRRRKKEEKVRR